MTSHSALGLDAPTLKGYIWRQEKHLRNYTFWRILSVVSITPFPIITKEIIDGPIPNQDIHGLLVLTGYAMLLLVLHFISMRLAVAAISEKSQVIFRNLRARVFHKLNFMHFGFLDKTQTGKLLSKYAFDTNNIEATLLQTVTGVLPELVRSVLLIGALMFISPWLGLVVLVGIPIFACARLANFDKIEASNHQVRLAREKMTGQASEFISAIKLVRGYGQEDEAKKQMGEISHDYSEERILQTRLNQTLGYLLFTVVSAITILATSFCGWLVIADHMSMGALVALIGALPVCLAPVGIITQFSMQYLQGAESYRSIKELIDSAYVEKWKGTRLPDPLCGDLEFRSVSFAYDETKEPVLKEFAAHVKPGEHVALVGASGSGKSTLVGLLLGFYAPTSGEILVDGVSQNDLSMRDFRQRCSIVMQDSVLLSGTLMDNIRFGKTTATVAEVKEAARLANALEFIAALPNGFDTKVGERGASLSGGQRQRIAIARALLRDPKVLILDEATSALDYESEKAVQEAINYLAKGRTTITIAHRLSTIRKVDRIIVMKQGRIEASGTWQELATQDGAFKDLLAAQD
jgi:ABC-type multidrug transport system fused ATPase/permease subunit